MPGTVLLLGPKPQNKIAQLPALRGLMADVTAISMGKNQHSQMETVYLARKNTIAKLLT